MYPPPHMTHKETYYRENTHVSSSSYDTQGTEEAQLQQANFNTLSEKKKEMNKEQKKRTEQGTEEAQLQQANFNTLSEKKKRNEQGTKKKN
jgi:hypothetical protein